MKRIKIKSAIINYLNADDTLISDIGLDSLFIDSNNYTEENKGVKIIKNVNLNNIPDWANIELCKGSKFIRRKDKKNFSRKNLKFINKCQKGVINQIIEHKRNEGGK